MSGKSVTTQIGNEISAVQRYLFARGEQSNRGNAAFTTSTTTTADDPKQSCDANEDNKENRMVMWPPVNITIVDEKMKRHDWIRSANSKSDNA